MRDNLLYEYIKETHIKTLDYEIINDINLIFAKVIDESIIEYLIRLPREIEDMEYSFELPENTAPLEIKDMTVAYNTVVIKFVDKRNLFDKIKQTMIKNLNTHKPGVKKEKYYYDNSDFVLYMRAYGYIVNNLYIDEENIDEYIITFKLVNFEFTDMK